MVKAELSGSSKFTADEIFYSLLKEKKNVFDLETIDGKKYKDVFVLSFSSSKKLLFTSVGRFSYSDVARLNFGGKESFRFYKEVLSFLPESNCLLKFVDKPIYIYPYSKSPEKWWLVKCYPYFYLLHRSKTLFRRGRKKKLHDYSVVYKLHLSAFTLFRPYRESLISQGEPVRKHEAGVWREELKETTKMLIDEFKSRGKPRLLVTVALRDGREITGIVNKRNGLKGFFYVLADPDDPKAKIFIYKHAVDDFWVDE